MCTHKLSVNIIVHIMYTLGFVFLFIFFRQKQQQNPIEKILPISPVVTICSGSAYTSLEDRIIWIIWHISEFEFFLFLFSFIFSFVCFRIRNYISLKRKNKISMNENVIVGNILYNLPLYNGKVLFFYMHTHIINRYNFINM